MTALANGREIEGSLYFYTCDHGLEALGTAKLPLPHVQPRDGWVMLTNLDYPVRQVFGETLEDMAHSECDHFQHRYRAMQPGEDGVMWWMDARKKLPDSVVMPLELRPGVSPMHWFVSTVPVKVMYDPIGKPSDVGTGA